MKYIFGPDAFRDNEHERKKIAEAIERLEMGDDIEDLEIEELERIVSASSAEGSNLAAVAMGILAQSRLDDEAERIGTQALEDQFNNYWGDKESHQEDRDRQDLRDAGRYHG